jgi:hypothetical protein
VNTTPYPAEVRITPRRRRPWRAWLFLLAAAALVIAALAWAPRAQPAARQAPVAHHPLAPAKPGITVTVGKTAYACTIIVLKPPGT